MAITAEQAFAAANAYTDDSLKGIGALKGAACQIQEIVDNVDGTHTITFLWKDNSDTDHTSTLTVSDGADGKGIKSVEINADEHLIITYDDETTFDAGKIEVQSAVTSVKGVEDETGKKGDVTIGIQDIVKIGENLSFDKTTNTLSADAQAIDVDSELSNTSENPVQNKAVKSALDQKADSADIPTNTSDLTNDSNFVSDADYVHTDNNYDDTAKAIVEGAETALDEKVDKETGKGLSTNDYTNEDKTIVLGVTDALNNKVDKNGTDSLMTADEHTKLGGIASGAQVNTIEKITVNGTEQAITDKTVALTIMTNVVDNLVNYYKKSETYTQAEVDALIASIVTLDIKAVDVLPTENISRTTIYLVPKTTAQTNNLKDEYINTTGTIEGWEKIGDTEIDLSNYITATALNAILSDYVTSANLTTILSDYATLSAMNTALSGKLDATLKGASNGLAELGADGKVPSAQLPSLLELGETSTTAYRGDRGKTAYDDSQANKTAIGTLANLTTTEKSNLVGAVNEVEDRVGEIEDVIPSTAIAQNQLTTESDVADDVQEVYKHIGKVGAKNLLLLKDNVVSNIKFTVDSDGYVTSNSSSDARQWNYSSTNMKFSLPAGKYTFSLKEIVNSSYPDDTIARIIRSDNEFLARISVYTTSNSFELKSDTDVGIMYKVFDGKYGYMLRYAEDTDDTFQPYAKNNQELTANVNNANVLLRNNAQKNLLDLDTILKTVKGKNTSLTWAKTGNRYEISKISYLWQYCRDNGAFFFSDEDIDIVVTVKMGGIDEASNTKPYLSFHNSNGSEVGYIAGTAAFAEYTLNLTASGIYFTFESNGGDVVFEEFMIRSAGSSGDYVPYMKSNQELTAETDNLNAMIVGNTGKNLLHIDESVVTQTINGVTFTVNRNEYGEVTSIVANGTASSQSVFTLNSNVGIMVGNGEWISGAPDGANASTYFINIEFATGANLNIYEDTQLITGIYVLPEITSITRALIYIRSGQIVSNVTFQPMIRKASITDNTFEPYAKSNQELTSDIQKLKLRTAPVYGFHITDAESEPSSKVTYLADAVGMTPAYMDYANGVFNYGSWADVWFVRDTKPCILGQDGNVQAYLDKNDYTKDIEGNTVVIDENLTGANVMIEFPKIWYKVVPNPSNANEGDVYISPVKVDEDYVDYAYIYKDGNHKEHFYMPAYNGSLIDNVLRSISGQAVMYGKTAQQEVTYAKANGDRWDSEDAGEIMLINFLLILMGKSTNTQAVFGNGITEGSDTVFYAYRTGAGNSSGMFFGSNDNTHFVKVFGIENWWGLQWRRYSGDILANGVRKIKLCYGNEDGSTVTDYNFDGTGYVNVGVTPSGTGGGYINKMKFTKTGMYSAVSSGSASTHYCDGQWFNNSITAYALRGGDSADGSRCGAVCVRLGHTPSYASWVVGRALSYK